SFSERKARRKQERAAANKTNSDFDWTNFDDWYLLLDEDLFFEGSVPQFGRNFDAWSGSQRTGNATSSNQTGKDAQPGRRDDPKRGDAGSRTAGDRGEDEAHRGGQQQPDHGYEEDYDEDWAREQQQRQEEEAKHWRNQYTDDE
ncbi:unnamed protein product, partial [Amoebophrya sp. A25]